MYKELSLKDFESAMKDLGLTIPYIGLVYKNEDIEIYKIGENCYTGRQGYINFIRALEDKVKEYKYETTNNRTTKG